MAEALLRKPVYDLTPGMLGNVVASDGCMVSVLWPGRDVPIPMYRHEVEIIEKMAVDGVYLDDL